MCCTSNLQINKGVKMRSLLNANTIISIDMGKALKKCEKEFGLCNSFMLEKTEMESLIDNEDAITCYKIIIKDIYNFDALLFYMQFHYDVIHSKDNFIPPAGLIKLIDKFCFNRHPYECIPEVVLKAIQDHRENTVIKINNFRTSK